MSIKSCGSSKSSITIPSGVKAIFLVAKGYATNSTTETSYSPKLNGVDFTWDYFTRGDLTYSTYSKNFSNAYKFMEVKEGDVITFSENNMNWLSYDYALFE